MNIRWQSGRGSYLADITTQFVKWHPEDVASGDPGYTYRGRHKYGVWVRGGGGVLSNIWSANGWADNGHAGRALDRPHPCLRGLGRAPPAPRSRPAAPSRTGSSSASRPRTTSTAGSPRPSSWTTAHDLLSRQFRLLPRRHSPGPFAVRRRACGTPRDIVFRGNRGYRDKTPEFTQWGAPSPTIRTGRTVPDPRVHRPGDPVSWRRLAVVLAAVLVIPPTAGATTAAAACGNSRRSDPRPGCPLRRLRERRGRRGQPLARRHTQHQPCADVVGRLRVRPVLQPLIQEDDCETPFCVVSAALPRSIELEGALSARESTGTWTRPTPWSGNDPFQYTNQAVAGVAGSPSPSGLLPDRARWLRLQGTDPSSSPSGRRALPGSSTTHAGWTSTTTSR